MADRDAPETGPEPSLAARLARDRVRPDVGEPRQSDIALTASPAGPDEDPALELAEGDVSALPTGRVDAAHATLGRQRESEPR